MSRIRCDNAECVVYLDELARAFPHQFVLDVSTRPLGLAEDPARPAGGGASTGHRLGAAGSSALAPGGADVEARRTATRPAQRARPSIGQRTAGVTFALRLEQARLVAVLATRFAQCRCARCMRTLVDPDRRRAARRWATRGPQAGSRPTAR